MHQSRLQSGWGCSVDPPHDQPESIPAKYHACMLTFANRKAVLRTSRMVEGICCLYDDRLPSWKAQWNIWTDTHPWRRRRKHEHCVENVRGGAWAGECRIPASVLIGWYAMNIHQQSRSGSRPKKKGGGIVGEGKSEPDYGVLAKVMGCGESSRGYSAV